MNITNINNNYNKNSNLYSLHEGIHIKHIQSNITYNTTYMCIIQYDTKSTKKNPAEYNYNEVPHEKERKVMYSAPRKENNSACYAVLYLINYLNAVTLLHIFTDIYVG